MNVYTVKKSKKNRKSSRLHTHCKHISSTDCTPPGYPRQRHPIFHLVKFGSSPPEKHRQLEFRTLKDGTGQDRDDPELCKRGEENVHYIVSRPVKNHWFHLEATIWRLIHRNEHVWSKTDSLQTWYTETCEASWNTKSAGPPIRHNLQEHQSSKLTWEFYPHLGTVAGSKK